MPAATSRPPAPLTAELRAPLTAHPRWRLRLLGGWVLEGDTGAQPPPGSRAATLLLARLGLAPSRDHAREELASLLWPGADAPTGRARLRQALALLKALLEPPGGAPVLLADRRVLRLAPDALWCDVPAFEAACRAGQAALAQALYRGPLLPGRMDDWVAEERLRLASLHDALATPGGVAAGPAAPAAPSTAPAASLSSSAPPAAAARPPSPRLQTPSPGPAQPFPQAPLSVLPGYLTRLHGADLAGGRLRSMLADHRLVTVTGPGGVGKTRLAIEVAQSLGPPSPEAARRPASAAPPAGRVVFVPAVEAVQASSLQALLPAPGKQPLLLVLDNCEQLDHSAVQALAQRIEHQHAARWLFTSRRPLCLDGEHCLRLEPLPLPEPGTPPAELALNPAVALFVDRARAHRPELVLQALPASEQAAVVELMAWLEGLPLALELAALQLQTLEPSELLALLRAAPDDSSAPGAGLRFLARRGPRGGHDPRHTSMLAVVAWSWRLLDAGQQALLTRLCLRGPGAVTRDEATAMAGDGPASVEAQLDALVAQSVLRLERGPDHLARYRPWAPMREFVRARCVDPGLGA